MLLKNLLNRFPGIQNPTFKVKIHRLATVSLTVAFFELIDQILDSMFFMDNILEFFDSLGQSLENDGDMIWIFFLVEFANRFFLFKGFSLELLISFTLNHFIILVI